MVVATMFDFSGMPAITMNPFSLFPAIAYFAFPILPYEIFFFFPLFFAYYAEKPTAKITLRLLITIMTYWGAIYGGGVHYIALLAVTSGVVIDPAHSICKALPPPTPGPWCALLTGHVLLMVPMGTYFIYLLLTEKKKYGWLKFGGSNEKAILYSRCGLYFVTGGFSGNLPYFGQLAIQGLDALAGHGIYASTTWFPWYAGRGYIEFASYSSWLLMGFYFFYKAAASGKGVVMM
jgi:hypothetical protein